MSANREFGRDLRVADFVRDELSLIIQQQTRDPRVGLVSINEVKVSKDLSYADVYVSTLDERDKAQRVELETVLNKAAGYFRTLLAKRHSMRTTPRLRFHYDKLAESAPRMEALIHEARAADDQVAQRRGDSDPSTDKVGDRG
ncbi:MAG: 30S ribosome-binding factor RbfA [Pseudomonadales bacterium]